MRLRCPHCDTDYAGAHCGVPALRPGQGASITVICLVCKKDFDVTATPTAAEVPSWFQRVVRRKQAKPAGLSVVSTKRE